jgi:hypothetical protein
MAKGFIHTHRTAGDGTPREVVVTRYRAGGGSLHDTIEAARQRDAQQAESEVVREVADIFREPVADQHFDSVLEAISPYDLNERWSSRVNERRERFLHELATQVLDRWDDLKAVIEGPQGDAGDPR